MNELKKIQESVDILIKSVNDKQKYWYPLSSPTYGTEEIMEAIDSMCSFKTTMWEKTNLFEEKFSQYQGSETSVMVNSGSSADLLLCFLLKDLGKDDRDEILIPAVTWPTQVWSAMMAGFKIKLVDVDPKTLNIDYQDLESKITPKTRAFFIVHLMGNPCDMDKIKSLSQKYNIDIIEDCCEALGAEFDGVKVGNFGIGGSYSFFFSHHITTMEGGIIACDKKYVEDLKILRAHGWTRNINLKTPYDNIDPRYTFVNWGFNVRPTELQAGFGLHQLNKLKSFNDKRDELSNKFFNFIDDNKWLSRPEVHNKSKPSWLGLPILIKKDAPFSVRDITEYLEENGVETRPIVTGNISRHPVSSKFNLNGNFPGADIVHDYGFYVGLSPVRTVELIEDLILCFKNFYQKS